MHAQALGVADGLQPIFEAIATGRDLSLTLPASDGQTLVVSVRAYEPQTAEGVRTPIRGLDARQLELVHRAIEERIAEDVSVSTLSSIAGLSRSHFSQAFRRSVGRTPHEYVVRMRIDRAMKLMLEGDLPLSEIALATGFCDQAHFANTFRRATGTTPKRWRQSREGGRAA
jgi:AraC family transcriptional regulator